MTHKHNIDNLYNETYGAEYTLLHEIIKIPGDKILTLASATGPFKVDVNKNGEFGYEAGIKELFLAKLVNALHNGTALIIRQFLPVKVKRKLPNGQELWIPEKNIYAVVLGNGQWRGCTAEEVESCCNTDANTGKALLPEEGVHYQEFVPAS
uniref:Uncharacterized protein n=1 Tax=Candidatus Kentrum sp. LPFa TaxID=2126335 RepID=A0A450X1N6_9GAMM|nr:MAG: hypothetical protein BECKLPF1236B_GA0070989_13452 [Candidatus Kentron sp. LPFa]